MVDKCINPNGITTAHIAPIKENGVYRDEQGRITIDRPAAMADVKRMQQAVEKLKATVSSLNALQRAAMEMKGSTAEAINEKSNEIEKKILLLITQIEICMNFINKTVNRYEQIDRDLRVQIMAANIPGCR